MDQNKTWRGDRPQPRPHCVRWGPSSPNRAQPPIFGSCLLWPSSWMDQDVTWYGGRPRPWRHCVRWGPSSPPKGAQPLPNFWPMSIVAKQSPMSAAAELLSFIVLTMQIGGGIQEIRHNTLHLPTEKVPKMNSFWPTLSK